MHKASLDFEEVLKESVSWIVDLRQNLPNCDTKDVEWPSLIHVTVGMIWILPYANDTSFSLSCA